MKTVIGLLAMLLIPAIAMAGAFPVGSSWGPQYQQGGLIEWDGVVSAIGYQSELAETGQETITEYSDITINGTVYKTQQKQEVTPFVGLLIPCGATATGHGPDTSGNSYLDFSCSCPVGRCGGSFCCTHPGNHVLTSFGYQNYQNVCPTTTSSGCGVKLDGNILTTGY